MDAFPPNDPLPARLRIGILVFLFCCLSSSARLVRNAPSPFALRADDIAARSDNRFAPLKSVLPARGVIGYIGESGNSGTADYYLAQYALAPLVIEHSPAHALVVGSFPHSTPEVPANLELVRNFGHGVLLLRGKDVK
jgi:hypothetical protein